MKFTSFLIAFIAFVVLLSSCTKEKSPVSQSANGEKDNNGIWYLKRNATFKYSYTTYDTASNIISNTTVTNTIDGDTLIQGVQWYRISDSKIFYYRNLSDGLHRIEVRNGVVTGPYLLYKYPTSLNDTYVSNDDSVLVDNYVPSSLSDDATIIYEFTRNGKKRSYHRINSGKCPDVINIIGYTLSGRDYLLSSMVLQEATWPY